MLIEKTMYWFSRPLVTGYTGTMLRMDVRKHEPMPRGPKIVAANHPATSDPFFVAAMIKEQSFILINNVLFQVPVLGEYLRRSGHIPVAEGKGAEAMEAALDHLARGHNILIFPEGALSPIEGGFQKPCTGVARLAILSGAPVIPVGVHLRRDMVKEVKSVVRGEEQIGRWYPRGPYNLTVGSPLVFGGDVEDRAHVNSVAGSIMHHIIELARESEMRMTSAPGSLTGALEPM